jgi:hypothetical protein
MRPVQDWIESQVGRNYRKDKAQKAFSQTSLGVEPYPEGN